MSGAQDTATAAPEARRLEAAGEGAEPVAASEFERLMAAIGPFEARPRLAVAVSGGRDSMALCLLAEGWARVRGGSAVALTVDHRLREGSQDEALEVARWMAARGIEHQVLPWTGAKPTSGIQAAAREARYRLLATWCAAAGILHLLVAHQRQDQMETVALRKARGSGPDGAAGMAAVVELSAVRVVRPLLAVGRERLAATLAAAGQPWLEDPSNVDRRFARGRMRTGALADGEEPRTVAEAPSPDAALARVERERAVARLLAAACVLHPAGFAWLDRRLLASAPREVALGALGRILLAVGGRIYAPPRDRTARLCAGLCGEFALPGTTLGGCLVALAKAGESRVLVCREERNLPPPRRLAAGESVLWDGRFRLGIATEGRAGPTTVAALGRDGWARLVAADPEIHGCALPHRARLVLPAFGDRAGLACVPHLGFRRSGAAAAEASFRPRNSLSPVGFFLAHRRSLTISLS